MSLDLERGLFHCFSRDDGGDVFRFYELMHGVPFIEAFRALAAESCFHEVDGSHDALDAVSDQARKTEDAWAQRRELHETATEFLSLCMAEDQTEGFDYLRERGISGEIARSCGVVYFPRSSYKRLMKKMLRRFDLERLVGCGLFNAAGRLTFYRHRLLFPFQLEGQIVYIQARTVTEDLDQRWHNLRGAVPSLYNIDSLNVLPSGSVVYLVEGFTDILTLLSHGFNAVGIVGAGGFRPEWLAPLGRFRVIAALDGDEAGQAGTERYEEIFAGRGAWLARVQLSVDVNDYFRKNPAAPLQFQLLTEAALDGVDQAGRIPVGD